MNVSFEHVTWVTYVAVYAAGLVTSFTPCIYPIIPIVVGFLGSRQGSFGHRVTASLAYALGLAIVYSSLGMIAALTGNLFGSLTTNPWIYLGFGVLLLVLGGSMMEWYVIPWLNGQGLGPAKSSTSVFWGPLLVGASSGLVASPCSAPVLATLLVYVASTKAVVNGAVLLFLFSLGMSTILLAIGLFAGTASLLPKSGMWMVRVKKGMALIMIAAGIYFIFAAGKLA